MTSINDFPHSNPWAIFVSITGGSTFGYASGVISGIIGRLILSLKGCIL